MSGTLTPPDGRDDLAARLSRAFQRSAEASQTRGAQAALVRDGELAWVDSYGLADVEASTPVDDGTLFCLASLGKTLLAALTLHLVERGVLALDLPIADAAGDDIPGAGTVTLRMLLTHTAGYPNLYESPEVQALMPPDPDAATDTAYDPDRPFTWEMLLPGILEPVEPGEHWAYSNTGYIVLSEVLSRVLGDAQGLSRAWTSFVGAAGDRYEPSSDVLTFERDTVDVSRLAHGYEQQDDGSFRDAYADHPATRVPTDLFGLPFGDGLFAGTATGVAVLLDALFVRDRMLTPQTLGEMTATTAAAAAADVPDPDLSTYGMGTFRMTEPGGVWQGHRGRYGGFSTLAGSRRATGETLVVLTNSLSEAIPVLEIWHELVATLAPASSSVRPD
jgi:CubicO group peptidase (beta-lactamase class C family)